jgi:hypothetical protein
MAIPGCAVGPHSDVAAAQQLAVSPTVLAAAAVAGAGSDAAVAAGPVVRSIADFNAANPHAPSAVAAAVAAAAAGGAGGPAVAKLVVREDGAKLCVRHGCRAYFHDADNGASACRYHPSGPVFHEGSKYWACCAGARFLEFDAFMAHPGCATGHHLAGTA